MELLLHVVGPDDWRPGDADEYRPASLDDEGFVHCSRPDQVLAVAEAFYADREDLELLCLDADRLTSEVRYEALGEAEEPYPHVYGPVNADAVVDVVPLPRDEAGGFALPARVRELEAA